MKVKSIGNFPNSETKVRKRSYSPFKYLDRKQGITIIILLCIFLLLGMLWLLFDKSNYEKGLSALEEKDYKSAMKYFSKIKTDDEDFEKAFRKRVLVDGLLAFEEKNWEKAIMFLSLEIDPSDQRKADSLFHLALPKYYESKNLDGLALSVTLNSLKYSGVFTRGCEIIFQLTNNSNKPLIMNSDNFSLVINSDNKFYKSNSNPSKTQFFNTNSLAGKDNYAYSFAVKASSTLKMMLNFDDIHESETNLTQLFATNYENSNEEYRICFDNNELMFKLQKDAWLIYPINRISLRIPNNTSKIMISNKSSVNYDEMEATDIVRKWIDAIGNQNLETAFELMTQKKRGSFEKFSSTKLYGGISKTNIFSIIAEKVPMHGSEEEDMDQGAVVSVDYEAFDPYNKDGRFKQKFYLTMFDENGEYGSNWKIYDIKNVEVNYYN